MIDSSYNNKTKQMRRLLVIQEHNADKAGLHWDVRFEYDLGCSDKYDSMRPNTNEPTNSTTKKVLKSFVIPKHTMPQDKALLTIGVEDHPWEYKDFEGEIKEGYGKGTVKLIHNDYVHVPEFTEDKIVFLYNKTMYQIKRAPWMKGKKGYLITKLETLTDKKIECLTRQ